MSKNRPPLGQEQIPRVCNRLEGYDQQGNDVMCGQPAAFHLIWDIETMANGFCCMDHAREATEYWHSDAYHQVGVCCGMPGSCYYPEENVCRYDEDGLPVAEPYRRILAEVTDEMV